MLQKLNSVHANNKAFLQPRNIHDARFGIAHFAGEVYYQTEGRLAAWLTAALRKALVQAGTVGRFAEQWEKESNGPGMFCSVYDSSIEL